MNSTRIALLFFGALALAMVVSTYIIAKRIAGVELCENEEVSRLASPDGKVEAVVFERNCGATTSYSAHVSILEAGTELPNEFGNAVSVRARPGAAFGDLRWDGQRTLFVPLLASERTTIADDVPLGVSVEARPLSLGG